MTLRRCGSSVRKAEFVGFVSSPDGRRNRKEVTMD